MHASCLTTLTFQGLPPPDWAEQLGEVAFALGDSANWGPTWELRSCRPRVLAPTSVPCKGCSFANEQLEICGATGPCSPWAHHDTSPTQSRTSQLLWLSVWRDLPSFSLVLKSGKTGQMLRFLVPTIFKSECYSCVLLLQLPEPPSHQDYFHRCALSHV